MIAVIRTDPAPTMPATTRTISPWTTHRALRRRRPPPQQQQQLRQRRRRTPLGVRINTAVVVIAIAARATVVVASHDASQRRNLASAPGSPPSALKARDQRPPRLPLER